MPPICRLGAVLLLLAAACTRSGVAPPAASVRFAIAADPQTLDPLFAHADANSVEQQLARLAFEPFIDIDAHGRAIPVLLARIPTVANGDLSRDGRTIVYHLRAGVRWQDGVPVTATDVLFTLRAIVDPRNPIRSREGYDRIARAERIDDTTVRIVLKAPWAPAVATLFSYGTAPQYVLPAHLLAKEPRLDRAAFGGAPVGNGPYRFVSWDRGERLVYAANPAYWRGAPAVARLDIRVVPDPGTNFTSLLSGALDWNLISPVQQQALLGRSGLAFAYVPLALIAGVAINTAHPPLDDVRVRRAIAAAIDRQAISDKITFKRYPVVDTAQPLGSWARDPAVRLPAYDPADGGPAARRGRLGARRGRHPRQSRPTAGAHVRAVSRKPNGRPRGGVHRARAARARHRSDLEVGHQRETLLTEGRGRRAGDRGLRLRVRAVADGRRSGR